MTYYKVLRPGGVPNIAETDFLWPLPANGQPGDWTPRIDGELIPCERGYHLCRRADLVYWLGPEIYEAEAGEPLVEHNAEEPKIVCATARLLRKLNTWNERTARLFACDCAERALPIFEKNRPGDARPRKCIEVARLFVDGKATARELAAARAAAGAAAEDAAEDAAGSAAWFAAWSAARAAAGAAGAAAGFAAGDAAGAAGAAAGFAAEDAAGFAAEDAAGSAAWSAARAAAGHAEREWQTERLFDYLEGRVE